MESSGQRTGFLKVETKLVAYLTSNGPENLGFLSASQQTPVVLDGVSYPGQSLTLPWPAFWVEALASWCLSKRPKQILRGLPGKFPFKPSLCPALVWC